MSGLDVLVALIIAVGLVGILVPILPGSILILGGVLLWAWQEGGATAWVVLAAVAALLVVGFVLGVYLAEYRRVGSALAWPSTKHALRAVGVSILIELVAGLAATAVWVAGVVAT